jgi:hypothetical protein
MDSVGAEKMQLVADSSSFIPTLQQNVSVVPASKS